MKTKTIAFYSLLIVLSGVFYFPVQAQQKNGGQDVVYQLDIKKSKLFWKAPKNQHDGFILFSSGTLHNFNNGRPTRGTFGINMNSMRSTDEATEAGRKRVDEKLRSEDFFAVAKYPTATMLVKQLLPEKTASAYRVIGDLTIKNVTKPIEFTAIMKQNGNTITATAHITISRANWKINRQQESTSWGFLDRVKDNLVDDEIPVRLELVFTRK